MIKAVTYIIVTWNNEKEIVDCLDSLYKYSPLNSKVVVVDNNSNDRTIEIIRSQFPKVELVAINENLGFAVGNNIALDRVESDFICYLNPDVILTEDFITASVQKLEDNPNVGIVSCELKNVDLTHQPSTFNFANSRTMFFDILHIGRLMPNFLKRKYFLSYYTSKNEFFPEWVIGAEMVLRTIDAKAVQGFSTDYFMYTEDMDLCKKVLEKLGKKTLYLSSKSLIHIGGASESQNVSYNKQKKMFENIMLFVSKYYGSKEVTRTLKNMIIAYKLRLKLIEFAYCRQDKQLQLAKVNQALEILKELKA
ncbi:glycosyltransferase family 2 protein [Streptococcus porcinus]